MQTNLSEIQNYLKDKQICLLGNARSILNTPKDIDKYEIIIRMNHGLPQSKEKFIGSRTDILCTSTNLGKNEIVSFATKYLMWMTKDKNLIKKNDFINENAIQNPPEDWEALKAFYPQDKIPSTGIIVLKFLLKHIQFKTLSVYGYDHFASGTFYHNLKNQQWHPCELEKDLFNQMVKRFPNVEVNYEC